MPNEMLRGLVSAEKLKKIRDYSWTQHLWFNIEKIEYNEWLFSRFYFQVVFIFIFIVKNFEILLLHDWEDDEPYS